MEAEWLKIRQTEKVDFVFVELRWNARIIKRAWQSANSETKRTQLTDKLSFLRTKVAALTNAYSAESKSRVDRAILAAIGKLSRPDVSIDEATIISGDLLECAAECEHSATGRPAVENKLTGNQRMLLLLQQDHRRDRLTAEEWAELLGVSKKTILTYATWKAIMESTGRSRRYNIE
jgi:hypothetical protein